MADNSSGFMADNNSGVMHGGSNRRVGEDDRNQDPRITPKDKGALIQGENQGNLAFQKSNPGARYGPIISQK